jgi:hypothetical protein
MLYDVDVCLLGLLIYQEREKEEEGGGENKGFRLNK